MPTSWRTTTAPSAPSWRSGGPTCTWWPPVATRRSATRFSHWTRALRAGRAAVLLQPDLDLDGDLAGTTLPRRSIVALTAGRGYLVCGGELGVVQVMALHEND